MASGDRNVLGASSVALFLGLLGGAALQNFLFKLNAHDPFIYSAVAVFLRNRRRSLTGNARESDGDVRTE